MEKSQSEIEFLEIILEKSPSEADVAIVSVNLNGSLGELNSLILRKYGYSNSVLPHLNLEKGYDLFQLNGKPILFVVTIGNGSTETNLKNNLYKAIKRNIGHFEGKKVWLPLLGTGVGGLNYEKSYLITIDVLERLKNDILEIKSQFILSIPHNSKGENLFNQLHDERALRINSILSDDDLNVERRIGESLASILIEDTETQFYLVDSDVSGSKDQSELFYREGKWENFLKSDKILKTINDVNVGDILINSSIKSKSKEYSFIIKALGRVTEKTKDSNFLKVNWFFYLDPFLEVEGLKFHKGLISLLNFEDLIKIFSRIDSKYFAELDYILSNKLSSNIKADNNISSIAGLISDNETGLDYLDISKDVNAFARVIAAKSFEPPLAIALLGKWGSGKSFFMCKLKERIMKLSQDNPANAFCQGIAHVHFNAWSYMDANLWASIVTRIFEGLNEYITNDTKAKGYKKQIEEKLTQNLNIVKDELSSLRKQNENLDNQIKKLKREKKNEERSLKSNIDKIKTATLKSIIGKINDKFKVSDKIEKTLSENETFIKSKEQFKKIVPEEYWQTPDELYDKLKSNYTFIKAFVYGGTFWKNCLWILFFIIIVLSVPAIMYLTSLLLSWQDFTISKENWAMISIMGGFFLKGIQAYENFKKMIAPFWKIKIDYEKEKENAIFKFNQKEKAINLQIDSNKNKIILLNEEINKASALKIDVEFRLSNAISTESLFTFIEKRANSEDYTKHLGIISIIRKDFEVLSDLLIDHKKETDKNIESDKFKKMFENPLGRIILYIDDLDRCPEERVVEVLEAVNLLMAFPLFVVIVGVDPRWVKKSLIKKYNFQFEKNKAEKNIENIEPETYLEKIFQIAFQLKKAEDSSIKTMIETLANTNPIIENIDEFVTDGMEDLKSMPELPNNSVANKSLDFRIKKSKDLKREIVSMESIKALQISVKEVEILQSMSSIVGNNPRTIKRFVNIYRILKTHEDFVLYEKSKLHSIMFLLALSIGRYNDEMKILESIITDGRYDSHTLLNWVSDMPKISNVILENSSIMHTKLKDFNDDYHFVKRFTFKNI
ncbi:P-loop NTPase fold protein [Flavobacterium sp. UBA4854]|uniref:P-loop NTPase fold protein n=1 Tax=Flavobacterium sp. UBA4854 TaxID=1946548 RepID=UPI00257DAF74|nr:P-loop NTPase fold protein [Flavobacterium sp. UBA4854]